MSKTSIEWSPDTRMNRCRVNGATMGTRYDVQFYAPLHVDVKALAAELETAVCAVDNQMSNWKPDSDLSRLNRTAPGFWAPVSANLAAVLVRALEIGHETDNAFNIGVGELVDAWGFGPASARRIDPKGASDQAPILPVSALLEVDIQQCRARRHAEVALDLCGIAKGFGVDELASVLDRHGLSSWLVGIDGEMRARGRKPDDSLWAIAVEAPDYAQRAAISVIELGNAAIATSGDYRHWADIDGMRISHTMDPRTGSPLHGEIASVTVIAPNCTDADAYATALMVLGMKEGRALAVQRNLDALFIVRGGGAFHTIATGCFADATPP
ncbi:MAG: FAD:protein FMN transferase [Paraburkholderia sp.]|uniref:FAD:protein FMN transferase n=1 Tax=Paraburkholderia sp. TaxID=1926495 RepID=UPI0012111BFC|nr:FAD:protein FMN transferase [Paraburkholderia sp.]TAM05681.1 MAG: FAD:protein FMN transferase [Paraburkholderia sp.]